MWNENEEVVICAVGLNNDFMIDNFEKYITFLTEAEITPDDFLMLYLLYEQNTQRMYTYTRTLMGPSDNKSNKRYGFKEYRIDYLKERGYLKSIARSGEQENSLFLQVTVKFESLIFIDNRDAGKEAWSRYPKGITLDGPIMKGTILEDTYALYGKKIGNDKVKHQFVLEMIEKGKKEDLLITNFRSFVTGEMWEHIHAYSNVPLIQ